MLSAIINCNSHFPAQWKKSKILPTARMETKVHFTSFNLENMESISPPDQHKRDRDTMVPKGWKLEKDASSDVAYLIQVFGHCMQ